MLPLSIAMDSLTLANTKWEENIIICYVFLFQLHNVIKIGLLS